MILRNNLKDDLEYIKSLPIIGKIPVNAKEEEFLREVVEFEASNLEEPGLMISFLYGNTKKSYKFNLMHGGTYRLPRFIARHIESCATPLWDWKPDMSGSGRMTKKYVGNKPRFQMRQVFSA